MQPDSPWKENSLLTGLRGIAAVWVAVFHFYPWVASTFRTVSRGYCPVIRDGFLGVDLFFLLSGFVLTMSYGTRLSDSSLVAIRQFFIARVFRIVPMHWTVLLVLAAIVVIIPGFVRTPYIFTKQTFLESVLLLQGLLPDALHAWNRSTWSISDECIAYLIFPLLVCALKRFRSMVACLSVSFAMLMALWCIVRYGIHGSTLDLLGSGGLLRCVCEFTAGAFACRAWMLHDKKLNRLVPLLTIIGLLVLSSAVRYSSHFALLAPFGLLALVLACGCNGLLPRLLFGSTIVVFLGEISYSLYLIHISLFDILYIPSVMKVVQTLPFLEKVFVGIFTWFVLIMLSWIGYNTIEQPFRRFSKQINGFLMQLPAATRQPETDMRI